MTNMPENNDKILLNDSIHQNASQFFQSLQQTLLALDSQQKNVWICEKAPKTVSISEHRKLSDAIAKGEEEAKRIFTSWANTIINNRINEFWDGLLLDADLLSLYHIMSGDLSSVSNNEKRFICHVSKLEDLLEVWLVRDLGFSDVWLVFNHLNLNKRLHVSRLCLDFNAEQKKINPDAQEIQTLCVTPEHFTGKGEVPIIRLGAGVAKDDE